MRWKRTLTSAVTLSIMAVGVGTLVTSPAAAQDRPTGVAAVKAGHSPILKAHGIVVVTTFVRCDPAWESAQLDAQVNRGFTDYAQGYTIPTIRCDNNWHKVVFRISTASGRMTPGKVTISTQFLVTNLETGDSAGAHGMDNGRLKRAYPIG